MLAEVEVRPDGEEHGDEEEAHESKQLSEARRPLDVHEVHHNDVGFEPCDSDCDDVVDPVAYLVA